MAKFFLAVGLGCAMLTGLSFAWTADAASPSIGSTGLARSCSASRFEKVISLKQAAQAIACDTVDRRLLIVGDYHGSDEIPDFVAQLMHDAAASRPVRLGLEMESFEQKPIQVYMASHGNAADRAALLHDDFWTAEDGRESKAIVLLIECARKLREEGRDVEVFATVPDYPDDTAIKQAGSVDAYRSAGMADAIHDEVVHGESHQLVIAFMGTAHSAYIGPTRGKDSTVTERLLSDAPYIVNLDLNGGSIWNCQSGGCGPHPVKDRTKPAGSTSIVRKAKDKSGQPAQVWVRFPRLTASPPAKEKNSNFPPG